MKQCVGHMYAAMPSNLDDLPTLNPAPCSCAACAGVNLTLYPDTGAMFHRARMLSPQVGRVPWPEHSSASRHIPCTP